MTTDSPDTLATSASNKLAGWVRRRKWWLLLLAALLFIASAWLSSVIWYSAEIRARVVTPDGRPVVGAIVAANWALEHWIHGTSLGQLEVVEVVTDKNGEFRIPQWGPLFLPSSFGDYKRATIRIFAPNFIPLVANDFDRETSVNPGDISRESLRKDALVLKPFNGSPLLYETSLAALIQSFDFIEHGNERCRWKVFPQLVVALQNVRNILVHQGAGKSIPFFYEDVLLSQAYCGDVGNYFREHLKNE